MTEDEQPNWTFDVQILFRKACDDFRETLDPRIAKLDFYGIAADLSTEQQQELLQAFKGNTRFRTLLRDRGTILVQGFKYKWSFERWADASMTGQPETDELGQIVLSIGG
jgi:hypothetical protein